MADTNKFQQELDNLTLEAVKLTDRLRQAEASVKYFENSQEKTAATDLAIAKKRLEAAEKQNRLFQAELEERKRQIKEHANQAKQRVREKTVQQIIQEENPSGAWSAFANKGGGGKKGIVAGVADVVSKVANLGADIYAAEQKKSLNIWMANQDAYLKTLETGSKIFQRHMKTFSKGMQGALSSSFASITQGVQEGAYEAASTSIDFATESLNNTFQDALDKLMLQNFKVLNQQKTEFENLKLTNQEVNGAAGLVGGVASIFGPIGQAVGGLVTGIASATTKILETNAEIDIMRLQKEIEIKEKELQAINEAKTSAVESSKEATLKVLDFSKSIETLSLKTDAAAKSMTNIIGMSGSNADMYEEFIYNAAQNLKFTDSTGKTIYLNKNAEDILSMQSQYIDASGRNNTMSQNDFIKMFQLGKVIGDDNLASALLGDMDYFNKSIETGTDLVYKMFKEANRAGVSNRKFAKDLQQNLKLAQKYTFKGGVEGMMKMSIWAQKTRFNMQSFENIVDNIQNGGLEGTITQAAKLQVLGGNMAMGADPLAMVYEAWSDPESLAKRFNNMTKGIGRFDSKTGEVDITGADAMRLKAYAEAVGMDYKDARAQVTQRIKGQQIDKQLTADYTDEQKALIYNKAKLGENGQWEVTLDNGIVKNVNNLQGTDWNSLMPVEESIENYVSNIYDLLSQQKGVTNHAQAVVAGETFDNLKANIDERMAQNLKWVTEHSDELKSMVEKSNDFVTSQNKQQQDLMVATTKILKDQFDIIEKATEKLKSGIQHSGSDLRLALDAVKKELDYELAVIKFGEDSEQAKEASKASGVAADRLSKGIIGEASEAKAGIRISQSDYDNAGKVYDWFMKESNQDNVNEVMGRLMSKYESGIRDIKEYEDILSEGHNDLMDALEGSKVGRNDDIESWEEQGMKLIDAIVKYAAENKQWAKSNYDESLMKRMQSQAENINVKDGVANSVKPMYVQASSITPIHDGSVRIAKSDPQDTALFAKPGGPFDTLFNGVFGRVDEIYDDLNSKNGNILDEISIKPVEVKLSGSVRLEANGQSVDLMELLNKNPMLIRQLSQMISDEVGKSINGGRSVTQYDYLRK